MEGGTCTDTLAPRQPLFRRCSPATAPAGPAHNCSQPRSLANRSCGGVGCKPLINPSFSRAPSAQGPPNCNCRLGQGPAPLRKARLVIKRQDFRAGAPVCRAAPPPAAVFYLRAAVNNSWPRVCLAVKRAAFCPAPPAGRCDLLFSKARPRRCKVSIVAARRTVTIWPR